MPISPGRRTKRQITCRAPSRHPREGFTIVEVVVAMMIFCVGVLAMASTAARTINLLSSGQSRTLAAAVAANRFERLRSVSCASHSSDSTTTRGIKESWTVVKLSRADDVTVVLTFTADHSSKSLTYREYLSCL